MQRVVSINLDGNAYQIEENGYNALFAYLDAFETALNDSPERANTLAELERRIAGKCQAYLRAAKTVVTSSEIDRILAEMEPVPGAPAAEPPPPRASSTSSGSSSSSSATSSSSSTSGPTATSHRRLYQIRDGAMISGVCVGLSEYMHIDVTIIRILLVIGAFASSGWGILAYGVLMFVLPKVDTRAQAAGGAPGTMPPHHWPWDDGWPWDRHGWPWDRPAPPTAPVPPPSPAQQTATQQTTTQQPTPPLTPSDASWREQRRAWREQRRAWREQRRAAYGYHPFSTTMMIFLMIAGFMWLSFWTRGHFFFGWPFFWGFPHWIGIIFFFVILRMIFMPFRMARYGYGPYGYAHPHDAWGSMWNGLAWFMVTIFAVWLAYHYIPEVHDMIRDFQTTWQGDISL